MSASVDYLIVGGGLSGCLLQHELHSRSCSTLLFDEPETNISTLVAAGIVNPITGKYFSLSWRAEDFFPNLEEYYRKLEEEYGGHFFHPMPILRILNNAGEENTWLSKADLEKYQSFFKASDKKPAYLKSGFKMLEILNGGYMDTGRFISTAHQKSLSEQWMRIDKFEYDDLQVEEKKYQDVSFRNLVFCEGYRATQNPWFSFLPFNPNKGELIEIECKGLSEKEIIIGSVFVLPIGRGRFKVGATYDHFDLSLVETEEKKLELIERLEKTIVLPFNILNHLYGIRPAVRDRRPLLGTHPDYPHLHIFNGMGSKAASMAPGLAAEMADYLVDGKSIHSEADIERFSAE